MLPFNTSVLPFIQAPGFKVVEIGNKESGILSVVKYGALMVNEERDFDEKTKHLPNVFLLMADLINQIAKERGISESIAYKVVAGGGEDGEGDNDLLLSLRLAYAKEIAELSEKLKPVSKARQLAGVGIIVRRMIPPLEEKLSKPGLSQTEEQQITAWIASLSNWNEELSSQLMMPTFDLLWNFFVAEQGGGEETEVADEPKKPQPSQPEPPTKSPELNGAKSSGNFSDFGLETQTLTPKTLASNLAG